jgi:hypothetical protein
VNQIHKSFLWCRLERPERVSHCVEGYSIWDNIRIYFMRL